MFSCSGLLVPTPDDSAPRYQPPHPGAVAIHQESWHLGGETLRGPLRETGPLLHANLLALCAESPDLRAIRAIQCGTLPTFHSAAWFRDHGHRAGREVEILQLSAHRLSLSAHRPLKSNTPPIQADRRIFSSSLLYHSWDVLLVS